MSSLSVVLICRSTPSSLVSCSLVLQILPIKPEDLNRRELGYSVTFGSSYFFFSGSISPSKSCGNSRGGPILLGFTFDILPSLSKRGLANWPLLTRPSLHGLLLYHLVTVVHSHAHCWATGLGYGLTKWPGNRDNYMVWYKQWKAVWLLES